MARKLARTVHLDGTRHLAGSTPPKKVARRITSRSAWEPEEPQTEPATTDDGGQQAQQGGEGTQEGGQEEPTGGGGGGDQEPAPTSDQEGGQEGGQDESDTESDTSESDTDPLVEPPRSGRGATDEAWRDHARALGVEVSDDAGRNDIIAMLTERGLIDAS